MSRLEKEKKRLKSRPKDIKYEEAKVLLNKLGFFEYNKGKTSGSRVTFMKKSGAKIELYRPHTNNILKSYQLNYILKKLKEEEEI